ncbi:Vinculin family-domain-containing protein [Blastocladiella britannica]|nr:Vinculin family-domain-containing protein [Blastocladiella britannica]
MWKSRMATLQRGIAALVAADVGGTGADDSDTTAALVKDVVGAVADLMAPTAPMTLRNLLADHPAIRDTAVCLERELRAVSAAATVGDNARAAAHVSRADALSNVLSRQLGAASTASHASAVARALTSLDAAANPADPSGALGTVVACSRAADAHTTETATAAFKAAACLATESLRDIGAYRQAVDLEEMMPAVVAAATAAASMPLGSDARNVTCAYADHVIENWSIAVKDARAALVAGVPVTIVVAGIAAQVAQTARSISSAPQENAHTAGAGVSNAHMRADLSMLASLVGNLISVLQHEADNSEDPVVRGRLQATAALAPKRLSFTESDLVAVTHFASNATAAVSYSGTTCALAAIEELPGELVAELPAAPPPPKATHDEAVIKHVESHRVAQIVTVAQVPVADDVVVIEEEAPEPLTIEEAAENPLKAAAQELVVETSRWSGEGNGLVSCAAEISNKLRILSDHYRAHSPQAQLSLLQSTKEVVAIGNDLQKHVGMLAAACSDKRLRADLLAVAGRLPTLTQQLKILASVRASAGPRDADSERQLVTCANNLMLAVKELLGKSEAASIRVSQAKVAGNVGLAVIKFRRNLYRGKNRKSPTSPSLPAPPSNRSSGRAESVLSDKLEALTAGSSLSAPAAPTVRQQATRAQSPALAAVVFGAKKPSPQKAATSAGAFKAEDLLTAKKASPARPSA